MELIFIGVIALMVFVYKNHSKIKDLEDRIHKLESNTQSQSVSQIPRATAVDQMKMRSFSPDLKNGTQPAVDNSLVDRGPTAIGQFIDWVKQDFMVKVGALLLLLALGWFVSYAFAENWIGEVGRITLGLFVGVMFLVLGVWRIQSHRHQGGIFTIIGGTTVLLTVFAARELYDLFTPISALAVIFLTVVFVSFVSVRYQTEKLAFVGLLMGGVAPLLTSAQLPAVELFSYLMVLALGTLWVVWVTGWTRLTLVALVVTYLYSLSFIFDGLLAERDVVLTFSFLFVSLFFVANMVSLVRRRQAGKHHMPVHTITALGTAIFLFTWIESVAVQEWKSLLYVSWALVFAIGTYTVFYFTANRSAFYLYGATSVALIGVATAAELNGQALVIAYLLEICALVFATGKITGSDKLPSIVSLLLAIPVTMTLESLDSRLWRDSVFHEDFFVILITVVVLFMAGSFIWSLPSTDETRFKKPLVGTFFAGAGFFVAALIWLISHAVLLDDVATTVSLVIYTVVGIAMFVYGKINERIFIRWSGAVLVSFVVLRLLLIDVWDMNITGRIVTFLIVGVLLISTAFIRKLQPPLVDQSSSANNES